VQAKGNFGVLFLGIDSPEISFQLPQKKTFTVLAHEKWEAYLSNPFSQDHPPFNPALCRNPCYPMLQK